MFIYLASQSPRRRELLEQIGVEYQTLTVDVEEQRSDNESPTEYVQRLSLDKAKAGALLKQDHPVLGADTIVVLNDTVLEKPQSEVHGIEMLLRLSGNTHQVMTAVTVVYGERCETRVNVTSVRFRPLSEQEARQYWLSGEPKDKAGGYGIQGKAAVFVEEIQGSYSSVVGLPLFETANLLETFF
ncbi:MAG: septum formation protein [Candidatus Endobugula sp.]|jgi:septum formation protein